MRVWVLIDHHEEVSVFSEDTDVLKIPYVEEELSYFRDYRGEEYDDEVDDFIRDLEVLRRRGGETWIEDRFRIYLEEVR